MQGVLFEPTGVEVPPLALMHAQKAEAAKRTALAAQARGWDAVARQYWSEAEKHDAEAESLAMLADFERLAGITR